MADIFAQRGHFTLLPLKFGGIFIFSPHAQLKNANPLTIRMISPTWRCCFFLLFFRFASALAFLNSTLSAVFKAEAGMTDAPPTVWLYESE